MMSDDQEALSGVLVANVTPFRDDLSVDPAAYLDHVAWLADAGIDGLVPFGTNGEGPSLDVREKVAILRQLLDRKGGRNLTVLPTVAEGNLPATLTHLAELEDLPVDGVLVLPPYYFPASDEGLRRFYEIVLDRTSHRVVVYHIPKYAVPVPVQVVTGLPVWGVKDSGGEVAYADEVTRSGRKVLLGTEDDYAGRLPGATAVVSALANVVPELVLQAYTAVRTGDSGTAEQVRGRLMRIRAATKEHASPAVLKAMARARHGAAMGTVRPPMSGLPEHYDADAVLRELGVDPG